MRWIFWGDKPPLQKEPGKDPGTGSPEKITVFMDAESPGSPAPEVRGVILSTPAKEVRSERFARYPHRAARSTFHTDASARPAETVHGICTLLHLPRLLCGQHDVDPGAENRIAYFTRGEYAGGLETIRLMAPSVRRALSAEPTSAPRQPRILPVIRTRPKLPPAANQG